MEESSFGVANRLQPQLGLYPNTALTVTEDKLQSASSNWLKCLTCSLGLPVLVYAAVMINVKETGLIVSVIIAVALMIGAFVFLKNIIYEHDKTWLFLIPGTLLIFVPVLLIAIIMISQNDVSLSSHFSLFLLPLAGIAGALWYNVRGVGGRDGAAVTVVQVCFAVIVVALMVGREALVRNKSN